MKKIFYAFIRFTLANYSRFYFKNLRVVGKENIPSDGAILFSPNHQNAFLDPLLVGTTAGKSIYSLTRSDVFGGPFQWFLDAMQTIPIYRIRDGYDQLKKNTAVFDQCYTLLGTKKHMMMFSEGKHHDQYYLLRLSKGSARLAIEAQLRAPQHPIYIQPVGLNYGNHLHARHDCVVVYGKPIRVNDYIAAFQAHPAKGLNSLRDALQSSMEACLWLPKNDAAYPDKKTFLNQNNTGMPFAELKTTLADAVPALKRANKDRFVYQFMVWLFSFPNLPAHLAINTLVKQFSDPVFHGSVKFLGGLIIFLVWWCMGMIGFGLTINLYWGLGFFLLSLSSLHIRQYFVVKSL